MSCDGSGSSGGASEGWPAGEVGTPSAPCTAASTRSESGSGTRVPESMVAGAGAEGELERGRCCSCVCVRARMRKTKAAAAGAFLCCPALCCSLSHSHSRTLSMDGTEELQKVFQQLAGLQFKAAAALIRASRTLEPVQSALLLLVDGEYQHYTMAFLRNIEVRAPLALATRRARCRGRSPCAY